MTTIAYRAGLVAADSRAIDGTVVTSDCASKLWFSQRLPVIYAGAGTLALWSGMARLIDQVGLPWSDEIAWGKITWPDMTDTTLMVVQRDGRIFFIEGGSWYEQMGDFHAMGSGQMAALAAMHMGADAPRAVEIAGKLDTQTGGKVVVLSIEDIPVKRRRKVPKTG